MNKTKTRFLYTLLVLGTLIAAGFIIQGCGNGAATHQVTIYGDTQ